jgi:hypothetical protein
LEFGLAEFDAGGFELIEELEQFMESLGECGPSGTGLAVVFGHLTNGVEVFGRRRDVFGFAISAIGEDGAFVELTLGAAAGGLAALSPQGVERSREEGMTIEARLQEIGELIECGSQSDT